MRTCTFTPLLREYQGSSVALEKHILRCDSCRVAAALYAARVGTPHERTEDCPDDATLAAYDADLLTASRDHEVAAHVQVCAYCLDQLDILGIDSQGDEDPVAALVEADRELNGYLLAKEIAEWLCTNRFQQDREMVETTFDITFDAASERLEAVGSPELTPSLGFIGENPSRAALIAFISTVAGRLRSAGTDVQGIDAQIRSLLGRGIDAHLRRELTTGMSDALRSVYGA